MDIEAHDSASVFDVLLSPRMGIWLSRMLRLLRGSTSSPVPLWVELGRLHAATFASAVRAGVSMSTKVPVHAGCVMVPTLGMALLPETETFAVADAEVEGGRGPPAG